ncbi:MAG: AEC family transporter [Pseudomonadota bacterium]
MIAIRIFEITFPIFAIVLAGLFYAKQFRPDMRLLNKINLDVFIPCLLFTVIYERAGVSGLFGNLALSITLVIFLSGIIAFVYAKIFQINVRSFIPPIMFGNAGNLGLPLVVLSFGDTALSAAVICFVVCNFFHITFGNYILSQNPNILKLFLSPMIIAVIAALLLTIINIQISNTLMEPIRMLGQICVPLMLFALGTRLIDMKLSEWKIGMLAAIISPLSGIVVVMSILPFIELTRIEQGTLFLFGSLPPAVMNYMLAEHYEQEPGKVAAMVLFGNAFAIISIPLALAYVLPQFA